MKKITHLWHTCMMVAVLMMLWVFAPTTAQADDEVTNKAYARLTDNTLTFYYNSDKQESDYNLNEGENNPQWIRSSIRENIEKVVFDESFNTYTPTTCYCWFDGLTNLSTIENIANLNTSEVTDMKRMFCGCSSLSSIDLSKFNTSKVTTMISMFSGCSKLSKITLSENLTNDMVTVMDWMFANCSSLKSLDLNHFGTPKVTSMYGMFSGCSSLTELTLNKMNTSNVVYMGSMFEGCSKLSSIDLSNFDTSNAQYMESMFEDCAQLTTLDLSQFNTSAATSMNRMFYGCSQITALNLSTFNTAKVTTMENMFGNCTSLTTVSVSEKFTTDALKDKTESMFSGCTSLVGAISYDATKTDATYANYTTGYFTLGEDVYARLSNGTLTFYCNSDMQTGDYLLADRSWPKTDVYHVVFDKSFSKVRPTTTEFWFMGMSNLKDIKGLEYLNTSEVTNMQSMFQRCKNLKSLDLSHFNTEKVTTMESMFFECEALSTLDLSTFNTAAMTTCKNMFCYCYALKTIYVSDTFSAKNDVSMFSICKALKGAIEYDNNKITATYANYTDGYFTKKVGTNGSAVIGATGSPLTIEDLTVKDGNSIVLTEDCNATSASYSRTMTSKWGTLCLPFAIDPTSEDNTCYFYALQEVSPNYVTLSKIEGNIDAGTPVVICKKADTQKEIAIKASNTQVVTAPVSSNNATCLAGTFTGEVLKEGGYFIAKNNFYSVADYAEKGVIVNPYRAYIKTADNKAYSAMLSIVDDGNTTGIDTIDTTDVPNNPTTEYYDATGRRIQGLQHGLNIVKKGNKTMKVIIR